MTETVPTPGTPGTGWRQQEGGGRWYQIERGAPEWRAWMEFYRSAGRAELAGVLNKLGRHWVVGTDPRTHGQAQLNTLAMYAPKRPGERDL